MRCQVGIANFPVNGRDVDDVSLSLRHHSRQHCLAAEKNAFQIRVDRLVPILQAQVEKAFVDEHARIVYQDMDLPKSSQGVIDDAANIRWFGNTSTDNHCFSAEVPNFVSDSCECF